MRKEKVKKTNEAIVGTPEKMTKSDGVDMLHGPLVKKIILFALPLAVSSILQQLFNSADTAVVGRFASSQAMAAVGSNGSLINLIISLFVGLSVGSNVVISSLIGRNREDDIPQAIGTSMLVALLAGIGLALIGPLIATPLLRIMNTPDDVIDLATLYLRIYFLGMPAIMSYNFGAAILRSRGDSKRPLIALTSAGVINVVLNLFFVIVLHLHVIGVAAATVISNYFSGGLTIWFLLHDPWPFQLERKYLTIDKSVMRGLVHIGLPAGLQSMVFSISNTVIQTAVNSFGSSASAGSAAALNFEIIGYMATNAFVQAVVTFTSQNYAAGKADRCRKVFRICMISSVAFTIAIDYAFLLTRQWCLGIFSTDPEVLLYANERMLHVLAFHFLLNSYEISGSALRGMGYSLTPTLMMIFGTVVFRVVYVLAIFPHFGTFVSLMNVYPLSWLVTGTIVLTTYFVLRRKLLRRMEEK